LLSIFLPPFTLAILSSLGDETALLFKGGSKV